MNTRRLIIIILSGAVLSLSVFYSYEKLKKSSSFAYFQDSSQLKISTGTFSGIFEKEMLASGLDRGEISSIIRAYGKKVDFRKLKETDSYKLTFSSAGVFKSIEINIGEKVHSVFKKDDSYSYKLNSIPVSNQEFELSGEIENNLWNSMSKVGAPPAVILNLTDIFSWTVDFLTEVRDGDKFKVFYQEKKTSSGKILGYKILAASYDGHETGRKISVEYLGSYYDEKGQGSKAMFLRAPLNYRRISSYFTYKRFHPVLKYVRPHLGIDYAAPTGTPVSAVADGRVTFVGWKGGYGNFVEITHSSGYVTTYGHLSRFSSNAKKGKRVSQGQVIGYVGMTGIATGPHLDFRIKHNGKFLNYLKIKNKASANLPSSMKGEFMAKVKKYFPEI